MNKVFNATFAILFLGLLAVARGEVEAVDGGYSGAWYNPAQSGHGVLLEVLENDQAFAAWFVFDEAGNPFWVVGTGDVEANVITMDVQALSGTAFPPAFDPDRVERRQWGTITMEFQSCSEAVLSWDSVESAFGSGQLSLNRLTAIEGLACVRTDRWLADLDFIIDQLLATHPNPFASVAQPIFETNAANLRERTRVLPENLIPIAFAELVATISDSHTAIYLPAASLSRLPIRVARVQEGLVITHATSANQGLLGSLLVAIDGVGVEEIERRLGRLIAHENDAWLEAQIPAHIIIPEALEYLGVAASSEQTRLRVRDLNGAESTVTVTSIPPRTGTSLKWIFDDSAFTAPLYLTREDNYWSSYLAESRTLYVAYQRAQQMPGQTVDEFAAGLETFALNNPVDRIVLDLRLNRGGNSGLLQRFIEGIPSSPFDDSETLFVLIGHDTFSSGMLNAFDLMRLTQATFVGQPTGGKPDHFGEVVSHTSPNFGLPASFSTRRFELLGDDSVESLFPDIRVDAPTRSQFLSGGDPFLDAVLGQTSSSRGSTRD